MKKFLLIALGILTIGITTNAQDADDSKVKRKAKTAAQKTKQGAKTVGRKTGEVASKGKSKVVDKEFDGKVGPDGQTIYIDKNDDLYWKDDRGFKYYISEAELKGKPAEKD
jgi:hypothetical protein